MAKKLLTVAVVVACLSGGRAISLDEEQLSPREFGRLLAKERVPAGIVTADGAFRPPGMAPATDALPREALTRSLDRFNRARGAFRAIERGGVVQIRSVDEPPEVKNALDRLTPAEAVDVPALAAVVDHIVWTISGIKPRGIVSIGSLPDPSCQADRLVRIPAGISAAEALDRIVAQAPGLVWIVVYDPEAPSRRLRLGLMCPDGYFGSTTIDP